MRDWLSSFQSVIDRRLIIAAFALGSLVVGISYFVWTPSANVTIELVARCMIAVPVGLAAVAAWRVVGQNAAARDYLASFENRVRDASEAEWDVLCRVALDGAERTSLPTDDPVVQELMEAGLLVRIGSPSLYGDSATYGLSDEARDSVLSRCRRPAR